MAKNLIDDIIDDLKTYSSNIAKFAAIEVRDTLAKTAYDAIEAFYADYEPEYYYRNYYNFRKNSYQKYYHNSHNKTFSGGIILTPENMDELYIHETISPFATHSTWGASAEQVFNTVMEGWHGLPSYKRNGVMYEGIRMKNGPSGYSGIYPTDVIHNKYNELLHDNTIIERAERKAREYRKYK